MKVNKKYLSNAVRLQSVLLSNDLNCSITFNDTYNVAKFGTDKAHVDLVQKAVRHYFGLSKNKVTLSQVVDFMALMK